MQTEEKEHVVKVANWLWPRTLRVEQVTDKVAKVVGQAFEAAARKGRLINMLPRPAGFLPGPAWLISEGVMTFWRSRGKRIPDLARRAAAYQWSSHYRMAKAGL